MILMVLRDTTIHLHHPQDIVIIMGKEDDPVDILRIGKLIWLFFCCNIAIVA